MSSKSKQEWQEKTLNPALERSAERKRFMTSSGMEVNALYTPEALEGFDYSRDLGYPGEYPFTSKSLLMRAALLTR